MTTPEAVEDHPRRELPKPPQTPGFRASQALRYQRQDAIREIEAVTGRRLICYVGAPQSLLQREDMIGFADLAHGLAGDDDVDLLIQTRGGDPDFSARVAYLFRRRVTSGSLRAVVPDAAKSAGTILAVAMDSVVMSDTSELGPVDPLIRVPAPGGGDRHQPALAYIQAFEQAVASAAQQDAPAVVWQALVGSFDPTTVLLCRQAVDRTRDIVERLLAARRNPSGGTAFTAVAANLLAKSRWGGHGAVISVEEASQMGLDVDYLPGDDDLWQAYWRLYCLQMSSLEPGEKLFESARVSLPIPR